LACGLYSQQRGNDRERERERMRESEREREKREKKERDNIGMRKRERELCRVRVGLNGTERDTLRFPFAPYIKSPTYLHLFICFSKFLNFLYLKKLCKDSPKKILNSFRKLAFFRSLDWS